MLCLNNSAKNLFAFAAVGCLSVGGLAIGESLRIVDSSVDNDSGRGSGRITTQVLPSLTANDEAAYRGTGRLHNGLEPTVSHRGSGRIDTQKPQLNNTAYRGSGRISTTSVAFSEYT